MKVQHHAAHKGRASVPAEGAMDAHRAMWQVMHPALTSETRRHLLLTRHYIPTRRGPIELGDTRTKKSRHSPCAWRLCACGARPPYVAMYVGGPDRQRNQSKSVSERARGTKKAGAHPLSGKAIYASRARSRRLTGAPLGHGIRIRLEAGHWPPNGAEMGFFSGCERAPSDVRWTRTCGGAAAWLLLELEHAVG